MTYIKLNDAAKRAMPKSAMMSRTGVKATHARPSLQEVMKSIDDYRASGASEEAVKQYSETVLRAWQAESGR
jgi:hypothetical protein